MVLVSGGTFLMGSDAFYPEERPAHRVSVPRFWIDRYPVTNEEFRVRARHRLCHRGGAATRPEGLPRCRPGAHGAGVTRLCANCWSRRFAQYWLWWSYVPGASWLRPAGPGSSIQGLARHPAVHIAYDDAEAYAAWAGKALPTEAEWEFAARGGLEGATFTWGDEFSPDGQMMANTCRIKPGASS